MAAGPPPGKSGGNVFTRKVGPLPAWGWMAIAAAGVLLLVVYEYRKQASSSSTGASTGASSADVTPPYVIQNNPPANDISVSGAPVPGNTTKTPGPTPTPGKTRQVTVGGPHATKDLYQLARQYGITEAELIKLNPGLKKYEGSGKPIPKKTKITV